MLLRSSSTPVSQTILVESKKSDFDNTSADHKNIGEVSFHSASHLCSFSCNSSSDHQLSLKKSNNNLGRKTPRRVQSEGNLKGFVSKCDLDEVWLVSESDLDKVYRKGLVSKCDLDEVWLVSKCDLGEVYRKGLVSKCDLDDVYRKGVVSKCDLDDVYRKGVVPKCVLDDVYKKGLVSKCDLDDVYKKDFKEMINDGKLVRAVTIGNEIEDLVSDDFSFGKCIMDLIKEGDDNEDCDEKEDKETEERNEPVCPMYLAAGFGIDVSGMKSLTEGGLMRAGHGADIVPLNFDEMGDVEAHYKSLLEEYPFNPLVLRNYAQLLQSKGDLSGAEEYYFQATLADPQDGDILSQYATLVWQLHHDKDRALSYFEHATHVDPENRQASPLLNFAAGFGIGNCGFSGGMTLNELIAAEDYYKSMIQENPNNPLVLRNYDQFLDQCKGDLRGAEEYYSRAVLTDASDGEIISQYANFIWHLHHDQNKASSYFKRAVQASPGNCDVLASYARFLWEQRKTKMKMKMKIKIKTKSQIIININFNIFME
ncbi:hypothetical protein EJD97_016029 [Solanum chilense]|uniref:Uncharacterized protein n=1 Tax=Solanum chilense TaxID=4083 RepID=A0A6N2B8A4_SOLCI|nr:hypothetical protein EJD97_016029 [Solanum chilense]